MPKPVLFYFVHAHGAGHRATFHMLYPAISKFFTIIALTTNHEITEHLRTVDGLTVLELPQKYPDGYIIPEHTFSKPFEVTPYAIEPAKRAVYFGQIIEQYRPVALYCDGVPEVGIMARSMGLPVVLVHLPGDHMNDPTQVFAYELADHIIAHYPKNLERPQYQYENKTFYSGYISKYAYDSTLKEAVSDMDDSVTILMGYESCNDKVVHKIMKDVNTRFTIIGNRRKYDLGQNCRQHGRVDDISREITGDVVITAAGQNSIAELISLDKRLILLPELRPYDEQMIHADMLVKKGIALIAQTDFTAEQWKNVILKAKCFRPKYDGLVNKNAPIFIAEKLHQWYGTN